MFWNDPCEDILTIPQFTGTCWFNSIITATLYSQHIRQLLKHTLAEQKEDDPYVKELIFDIVFNKYKSNKRNPAKDFEYFNVLKPEELLLKLHKKDKSKFNFNPNKKEGYHHFLYLYKFLDFLGIQKLGLMYLHNSDLYLGRDQRVGNIRLGPVFVPFVNPFKKKDRRAIIQQYDVLVVHSFDNNPLLKMSAKSDIKLVEDFEVKDVISFAGETYVLDSVLLTNFNVPDIMSGHVITGITCNGNRYIYNGWMKHTVDPAKGQQNYGSNLPCALMKYDWLNNSSDFCLNASKCNLSNASHLDIKNRLCFNTTKGDRTFIYVNRKHTVAPVRTPIKRELHKQKDIVFVMVYGLGCSMQEKEFIKYEKDLSEQYNVKSYVLCNTSLSGTLFDIAKKYLHVKDKREDKFVKKVKQFILEQVHVMNKKVILFGHSYGGGVVSRVAEQLKKESFTGPVSLVTFGSIYISSAKKTDGFDIVHYMYDQDVALKVSRLHKKDPTKYTNIRWMRAPHGLSDEWDIHNNYYKLYPAIIAEKIKHFNGHLPSQSSSLVTQSTAFFTPPSRTPSPATLTFFEIRKMYFSIAKSFPMTRKDILKLQPDVLLSNPLIRKNASVSVYKYVNRVFDDLLKAKVISSLDDLDKILHASKPILLNTNSTKSGLSPRTKVDSMEKTPFLSPNTQPSHRQSPLIKSDTNKSKTPIFIPTRIGWCPEGKVFNPKTGRCINRDGVLAKKLGLS